MNNYLSKSYVFNLLDYANYLITLCYLFFSFILPVIDHPIGVKFNLVTASQFKVQGSLKLGDISRPRLIKN